MRAPVRIKGEVFEPQIYVGRRGRAWIVRVAGERRTFPDAGNPRAAYVAAVAYRNMQMDPWPPRSLWTDEPINKQRPVGRVGVTVSPHHRRRKVDGARVFVGTQVSAHVGSRDNKISVSRWVAAGGDVDAAVRWAMEQREFLELEYARAKGLRV